jgi:hypothetical protein
MKIIDELRANRLPLHSKCFGHDDIPACSHADTSDLGFCNAYYSPAAKWRLGDCPLADQALRSDVAKKKEFIRVGQQKQKKNKKG